MTIDENAEVTDKVNVRARIGGELMHLALDQVVASTSNPRLNLAKEPFAELKQSIRENGLLQAIVVRAVGDHYEIVGGHRRFAAVRELASEAAGDARFTRIAALVIDVDDALVPIVQLAENVNRSDLSPLEIADGAARAIAAGVPSERVAQNLGWNRRQLNRYLQLHTAPKWLRAFAVEVRVAQPKVDERGAAVFDAHGRPTMNATRLPGLPFTHLFELITGFNALKQQDAERLAEGGDDFTPHAERITRKLAGRAAIEEWSSAKLRGAFKDLKTPGGRPRSVDKPAIVIREGRAVLDAAHAGKVTEEDRARAAPQLTKILETLGFKAVMLRS